jgi:hypothetical protein
MKYNARINRKVELYDTMPFKKWTKEGETIFKETEHFLQWVESIDECHSRKQFTLFNEFNKC